MRVFIAIDIGEGVRRALGRLQEQLQSKTNAKKSDVKWVRPDRIHLTLKFLGEVEDTDIISVCKVVKEVAARHKSFDLDIESVGYFGGRSARVVWVGTGAGSDNLVRLAKDLEEQLALAGRPKEAREFTGHLTLCRIRSTRAGFELAGLSEDYKDFKVGVVSADSVSVYQSRLMPRGPEYTVMGNYKLQ